MIPPIVIIVVIIVIIIIIILMIIIKSSFEWHAEKAISRLVIDPLRLLRVLGKTNAASKTGLETDGALEMLQADQTLSLNANLILNGGFFCFFFGLHCTSSGVPFRYPGRLHLKYVSLSHFY